MAIPSPGLLARMSRGMASGQPPWRVESGRLSFAHADWSGYSIFEEAFTRGHFAGSQV
jgi:hypothetical protein